MDMLLNHSTKPTICNIPPNIKEIPGELLYISTGWLKNPIYLLVCSKDLSGKSFGVGVLKTGQAKISF